MAPVGSSGDNTRGRRPDRGRHRRVVQPRAARARGRAARLRLRVPAARPRRARPARERRRRAGAGGPARRLARPQRHAPVQAAGGRASSTRCRPRRPRSARSTRSCCATAARSATTPTRAASARRSTAGLPGARTEHVVLLGAGGAGAAVGHAILALGAERLSVVDVERDRAAGLAAALGPRAAVADLGALAEADGLIHATPTGMDSPPRERGAAGAARPAPLGRRGRLHAAARPSCCRTPRERGCRTLDGGAHGRAAGGGLARAVHRRAARPRPHAGPRRRSCAPLDRHCLPERHARGEAGGRRGGGLRRGRAVRAGPDRLAAHAGRGARALRGARARDRALPAVARLRGGARGPLRRQPAARGGEVRGDGGARRRHGARLLERLAARDRRRRARRRAAARAGRARRRARDPDRLRGARVGAPRARLRPRVADRGGGRPPQPRHLPRLVPHPLARRRPERDPRHPGREDLLPPARRRAGAGHGRAAVEPPLPLLPGPGRLRPRGLPAATCWRPATTGRSRSRSSTTSSARPTRGGWRSTRCARCCCSRTSCRRPRRCAATRSRSWRWRRSGRRASSGC